MLNLPPAVDIREVGPRDGLQIEAPLPTEAKIRLLRALIATGVRRIEATAFVSPRAVPAMADAEEIAAFVATVPGVDWSGLVAARAARGARWRRACARSSTWCRRRTGTAVANVRRSTAEALDAVAEVADVVHDAGGRCEVIIATAWDCPFDGPTPAARTASIAARAVELGADQICLGDTIGTTTPLRVWALLDAVRSASARTCRSARTSTTPGAPGSRARSPPCRPASRSWTRRSAGWAGARSPRGRAGTSRPRNSCTAGRRRHQTGVTWPPRWRPRTGAGTGRPPVGEQPLPGRRPLAYPPADLNRPRPVQGRLASRLSAWTSHSQPLTSLVSVFDPEFAASTAEWGRVVAADSCPPHFTRPKVAAHFCLVNDLCGAPGTPGSHRNPAGRRAPWDEPRHRRTARCGTRRA